MVYDAQRGVCPICGTTLRKPYVFHHVSNKSQGGTYAVENCEARHPECEAWAHQADKHGNPTIAQINEYRRQRNGRAEYEVSERYPRWNG
jgi:hypothetical protein